MTEALFHIATRTDWEAARGTGSYTTSTRGRTLEQEGFIHASRRDQVAGVFRRFYADAGEPLVLLRIDPRRLDVEVREEQVGDEVFPHLYGPLPVRAVTDALPMNARGGTGSFLTQLLRDIGLRIALAIGAMLLSAAGAALGGPEDSTGRAVGALVGLLVGVVLAVSTYRWVDRRG